MTARIIMIKRIAGLILLPDDDDGLGSVLYGNEGEEEGESR